MKKLGRFQFVTINADLILSPIKIDAKPADVHFYFVSQSSFASLLFSSCESPFCCPNGKSPRGSILNDSVVLSFPFNRNKKCKINMICDRFIVLEFFIRWLQFRCLLGGSQHVHFATFTIKGLSVGWQYC